VVTEHLSDGDLQLGVNRYILLRFAPAALKENIARRHARRLTSIPVATLDYLADRGADVFAGVRVNHRFGRSDSD
jgi:hypothetical protein